MDAYRHKYWQKHETFEPVSEGITFTSKCSWPVGGGNEIYTVHIYITIIVIVIYIYICMAVMIIRDDT